MDQLQLRELEARCIQEDQPFCTAACPIHVDVRGFMAAMARGKLRDARRILDRTMPFPALIGRLCDQPCRPFCKRAEVGEPLAIGSLERYCVEHTDIVLKPPKLPAKGGRVVVAGAGLSGMTAALDLARKGRTVTLCTARDAAGGSLRRRVDVPAEVLAGAVDLLTGYGVRLETDASLTAAMLESLAGDHDVLYLDFDDLDPGLVPEGLGRPDPLTLALARPGWFGGGGPLTGGGFSLIGQVEAGRRAALTIERFLQQVSITAQRDLEGTRTTRMHTVVDGIAPLAAVVPTDPARGYTDDEARQEAGRCLQCECLECVKQCVYLREYKEYPKTLVRKIFNSETIVQGTRSANRMINGCSLCGQCTVICPNDFPVAEVCRASRRTMVETGHMPPSAHEFALEDMAFSRSEQCRLARHQPGTSTSRYLFYPGCQLVGSAPDTVRRTYELLCAQLPGGVGLLLDCCGIPAHWSGRDDQFTAILDEFAAEVERLGRPTVVVACSSCLWVFATFAPHIATRSLYEVLAEVELPADRPPVPPTVLALHDPCTARHQPELRAGVRALCDRVGLATVEADLAGELADCCGYGGLMQFANPALGSKAAAVKAERSPHPGLAYCAMCRDNLADSGRPVAHLLDYLVAAGDEGDPLARPNPGYSARHENRARLKRRLLAELWQETTAEPTGEAALPLVMDPAVRALLDRRHILAEDVRRVIHRAETSGRYLVRPGSDRRLAGFRPVRVTYWIEYEPSADGFVVHNGYSHRMQLPEDTL